MEETKKNKSKLLSLKKGGIIWSVWNFIEAALLMILGILAIVFLCEAGGDASKLTGMMSTLLNIVGIFIIIGGSLRIITNFMPIFASNGLEAAVKAKIKDDISYDLVIGGSLELALGIALVVMHVSGRLDGVIEFISNFLGIFIGVLILVAAASLIIMAISFIVTKLYKLYLPILELIFSAALIALGVVVLMYVTKPDIMATLVLIVLSIVLIVTSIGLIVITVHAIKVAKEVKNTVKEVKEVISNKVNEITPKEDSNVVDVQDDKKDE